MQTTRQKCNKFGNKCSNCGIVELHDSIWNYNEKCFQISPSMPGIGSVNRKIAVKMSEMSESKHDFVQQFSETNCRVLSVKDDI